MMDNLPEEDSEAITSLLQSVSERIRGELTAELGMILAQEQEHKVILSKLGGVYDKLVAPLIRELVLMEMRFTSRLDEMGKSSGSLDDDGTDRTDHLTQ